MKPCGRGDKVCLEFMFKAFYNTRKQTARHALLPGSCEVESMGKEIDFKNRDRFIQLGITISVLRKMRGMSQEKLAAEAMMSRSHLSAIEAPNVVRPFSLEILFNIADALEVAPGDLLNMTVIPDEIMNRK